MSSRPTLRGPIRKVVLATLTALAVVACTPTPATDTAMPPAEVPGGQPDDGGTPTKPGTPTPPVIQLPVPSLPGEAALPTPVRGAWVHLFDDRLKTRDGIEGTVAELAASGANLIIAQVIRRQDAYYSTDVLPRTPDPALADDLDVLAVLLDAAHGRGLQVHAWYSVTQTTHAAYDALSAPDDWLATRHGAQAPVTDRWVTRSADGAWSDQLDLGVPAVRDHVVAVVTDLASRYVVDGIHLDYVRYPSATHGYNPQALARFQESTGRTGTPDPTDPVFTAWRRERPTELVAAVRDALDGLARPVLLSAAVITWGPGPGSAEAPDFEATRTATEVFQDWPSWATMGLVDAVMPMNYFRAHEPDQQRWFTQWLAFEQRLATEVDARVVPGIGGWLNQPAAVLDQVAAASRAADGAVVYSLQQPTARDGHDLWGELAATAWGTR